MEISYSHQVQQALMNACEAAEECRNASVGTEHLLIGILRINEARLTEALKKHGITDETIEQEVQILFGFESSLPRHVLYTNTVKSVLKEAEILAQKKKKNVVEIDALSQALLEKENNVAKELLRRSGIVIEELIQELNQNGIFENCTELINMNQKAVLRKGKTALREKEIETVIHTLMKMEKSNCVLTGPAGVGKTAIVEELASRIERKQVPDPLKNCIIAELNVNQMVAGTKYRGEFEARIQRLMTLLEHHPEIILFIDELHLIVGAGKAEGSLDIASVLKPALSRKGIKVIGATTDEEYERWIEKDKALQRRFVRIEVKEPDEKMTLMMLKEKSRDLLEYHGLKLQKGLLQQCIQLSKTAFPHLKFPDKAIDVLDMSCSLAQASSEKLVTPELLKQAVSSLSGFPVADDQWMKSLTLKLRNDLSSEKVDEIKEKIKTALNKNTFSFVHLLETGLRCESIQNILISELNASLLEIHGETLSLFSFSDSLKRMSESMKTSRFQLIWITEAEKLREDLQELIHHNLVHEVLKMNGLLNCCSGMCVLCTSNERNRCGFVPDFSNAEMRLESSKSMDERKKSMVS